MKIMKKYIIISFVLGLLFTACNPNQDIYDEIKNNEKPYSETGLEYTLTSDDYSSAKSIALADAENENDSLWVSYISQYNSFNTEFSAYKYVPSILADNFPALNESSNAVVTFNQYIGEMYGKILTVYLNDNDYISMGGDIATNLYFSVPEDLDNLPGFLLNKLSNAKANDYVEVFYKHANVETMAGSFFKFNGLQWSNIENSRVLAASDYEEMGGSVANDGYFTEDAMPGNYLPQFLKIDYPYAQGGDEITIVCHLVDFESIVYAVSCKYNGSDWEINFPGNAMSAQFKHNGTKWYFDPAVTFTMASADYQLIVNHVIENYSEDLIDSYGTGEFYSGANSHYGNFDIRVSKRIDYDPTTWADLSEEDANTLIWERLRESIIIMLQKKFPNAKPDVEGVEVIYSITFDGYIGNYQHIFYTIEYKCTSAGSPPKFELVTDAVEVTE